MTTLHIEHPVTDFATWQQAFGRFGPARTQAGVQQERIYRPVDDAHYVLIDLDFADVESAQRFLGFLRREVWSTPTASPALVGEPLVRILEPAG